MNEEAVRKLKDEINGNRASSMAAPVLNHLIERLGEDDGFAEDVLKESKNWKACEKYLISKAKELGYNLHDKYYLFPKDFRKAHDRAMGIYQVEEAKRKDEEAQRFSLVIYQMAVERKKIPAFNLRSDGLMMVLPKDSKDLVREGSVLHHCVGTYTEKVAKGKTIIQCRGMRNSDPPADVRHFIHKFEDEMEKYQKQQRRGA